MIGSEQGEGRASFGGSSDRRTRRPAHFASVTFDVPSTNRNCCAITRRKRHRQHSGGRYRPLTEIKPDRLRGEVGVVFV
jgi:hypothetical protein